MNYDGPSFYKGSQTNDHDENSPEMETPLERLKKEQKKRKQLKDEFKRNQQKKNETRSENYYFRSTQIPKSLQSRDGWKKETWDQGLIDQLQKRLKKEPEDYLLLSDNLAEEELEEKPTENKVETSAETSAEAMRIKQMVAEIENTLDTAALVQKEMKPDFTKPNTGLHRTLSNIIAEDQNEFENGKNKK